MTDTFTGTAEFPYNVTATTAAPAPRETFPGSTDFPYGVGVTYGTGDPYGVTPEVTAAESGTTAASDATPAATPTVIPPRNRKTFDDVASLLAKIGLGGLFSVDSGTGAAGGWLWDQLADDIGVDALWLRVTQTDPYKAQFGIIDKLRAAKAGNPTITVPTEADVLSYRDRVGAAMKAAGLPSWFYDENSDFDNLMLNDLSPVEVEDRLGSAWTRVVSTNPAIKAKFSEFYGVADGDAALAAFYLDPEHTTNKLERASRAAYTSGMGSTLGLNIGKDIAERVADLPLSEAGINAGLGDVSGMAPLYNETISETTDLTSNTGLEASVFGSGEAKAALDRRRIERQSVNANSGGAAVSNRGVVGVG